jgi:hypothetical protein
MRNWEGSLIDVLLCAADLAERGAMYGLTEAVSWLGLEGSDTALIASYEALAVAKSNRTRGHIGAAEYLEAALRVAESRGVSA